MYDINFIVFNNRRIPHAYYATSILSFMHRNSLAEELLNLRSYSKRVSDGISVSGHVQF